MIGITGPSCSGKSTLALALAARLGDVVTRLPLDAYYRDFAGVSHHDVEVDVPEAIDHELLVAHLRALARGETIARPVYDFATHSRQPRGERVAPGRVVLVEGLFALYWAEVRALLAASVFVDAPREVCLVRRVARDLRERGRDEASVLHQFTHKVWPNYERYVLPTRDFATLVASGVDPIDEVTAWVVAALGR
jgi:uridine kinase